MQYIHLPSGLTGFRNSKTTIEVARSGREVCLLHGELKRDEGPFCPECGQKMHIHGSRNAMLRHLCFGSRLSAVSFEKRRYRCPCCGHTEMEHVPFKADSHNITRELLQFTRDLLTYGFTNKEVSELTGLGKNTVKEIDLQRLKDKYTVDGSIAIPDSVVSIGEKAFMECWNLSSIAIPSSVTSIADYMFANCYGLSDVVISDGITSIGKRAFLSCIYLTDISIPDSVTSVGSNPFEGCEELQTIRVSPDHPTLKVIYDVLFEKNQKRLICYPCDLTAATYTVPKGTLAIGEHAFSSCRYLPCVTIPDSVTSIGEGAFQDCDTLTSITIPSSVTSIGDHAFDRCQILTEVAIPNGVTFIGESAFCHCRMLTCVTIPNSVTFIGDDAFFLCDSLTEVTISDGVTFIGKSAFSDCTRLTCVTIPGSVTSISDRTFAYCESLTEVAISDGVASIGICAFSDCQNLTRVIIPRSVTSIDRRAFSNCSKKLVLTVERGSYAEEYASKQKIPHIYPDAGASQDAQAPSPSPQKKSNR